MPDSEITPDTALVTALDDPAIVAACDRLAAAWDQSKRLRAADPPRASAIIAADELTTVAQDIVVDAIAASPLVFAHFGDSRAAVRTALVAWIVARDRYRASLS